MAHVPSNRLRTVVFQAGLKAGLCPAPAASGPVCHGIALLLAHCLAAGPLPPALPVADRAKPPENRLNLPVEALGPVWQAGATMRMRAKSNSPSPAQRQVQAGAKTKFYQ